MKQLQARMKMNSIVAKRLKIFILPLRKVYRSKGLKIAGKWSLKAIFLLTLSVGGYAEEINLPSLEPLGKQIEILVRQYYPQAEVSISDEKIIFSNETMDFMIHSIGVTSKKKAGGEGQVAVPVKGPQRTNGIQGSLEIASGPWQGQAVVPQSFDKHYFTSLLMAPYSSRYNCHVIVHLDYPDTIQESFLKSFQNFINEFERYLSSDKQENVSSYLCQKQTDCYPVQILNPDSQNATDRYIFSCQHVARPLSPGVEKFPSFDEHIWKSCRCSEVSHACGGHDFFSVPLPDGREVHLRPDWNKLKEIQSYDAAKHFVEDAVLRIRFALERDPQVDIRQVIFHVFAIRRLDHRRDQTEYRIGDYAEVIRVIENEEVEGMKIHQPDVFSCHQDHECQIVTSSQLSLSQNAPGKTLIHCAHKDEPLKEGEWIREYNEYTQGKCICDVSSNQCRMKD